VPQFQVPPPYPSAIIKVFAPTLCQPRASERKKANGVIPNEVRNPSCVLDAKERFLVAALLGMTALF